jgi:excisionase family DNA binding protein
MPSREYNSHVSETIAGPEDLLGVRETAAEYGLSPDMLRRWIRRGVLPAQRIGATYVLRRQDVDAFKDRGLPRVGRPVRERRKMSTRITAIEFDCRMQEAATRFSIPVDIAELIEVENDDPIRLEVRGPKGSLDPQKWLLRSGKEVYGPKLKNVAGPGDEIRVRIERIP